MRLYVGVDLHANNNFVAIVDRKGKRIDQGSIRPPFAMSVLKNLSDLIIS